MTFLLFLYFLSDSQKEASLIGSNFSKYSFWKWYKDALNTQEFLNSDYLWCSIIGNLFHVLFASVFSHFSEKKIKSWIISVLQKNPKHIFSHNLHIPDVYPNQVVMLLTLLSLTVVSYSPNSKTSWISLAWELYPYNAERTHGCHGHIHSFGCFITCSYWNFLKKIELNSVQSGYFSRGSQEFFFEQISSDTQILDIQVNEEIVINAVVSSVATTSWISKALFSGLFWHRMHPKLLDLGPKRESDSSYYSFSLLPSCTAISLFGL